MNESNNAPEVKAALMALEIRLLAAVQATSYELANRVKVSAVELVNKRRANHPYPAENGQPPMKVTGALQRSIKGTSQRKGFGIYVAEVSAGTVYARALELGNPNWEDGQKFPYLSPAVRQYQKNNLIKRILVKNLQGVLR